MVVTSLLNTKRITETHVVNDDDSLRAYFKIKSEDLDALSNSDKVAWMDQFAQLLRVYTDTVKLLVATTPVDTSGQQQYYRSKLVEANQHLNQNQTERETAYWRSRRLLAQEALGRCINVAENGSDLNFYLVIFANNEKDMSEKTRMITKTSGLYRMTLVNERETELLLSRLNNMNEY